MLKAYRDIKQKSQILFLHIFHQYKDIKTKKNAERNIFFHQKVASTSQSGSKCNCGIPRGGKLGYLDALAICTLMKQKLS